MKAMIIGVSGGVSAGATGGITILGGMRLMDHRQTSLQLEKRKNSTAFTSDNGSNVREAVGCKCHHDAGAISSAIASSHSSREDMLGTYAFLCTQPPSEEKGHYMNNAVAWYQAEYYYQHTIPSVILTLMLLQLFCRTL